MSITEFLLARIAEDEAAAREALGSSGVEGTWHVHSAQYEGAWIGRGAECPDDTLHGYEDWEEHVNRHSPARVLAEIAAKRAILEFHKNWPVLVDRPMRPEPVEDFGSPFDFSAVTFRAMREIQWLTEREYIARFGTEPPTTSMLRALASVYADHPDFDPSWRL